eukprot:CAMPEP_0171063904 /NCGR_PEP_ID=MMETSP0766_2-20121228/5957_1 /TAXON_ID=439317 /ORGANISM="Gambierdiscus australes, Strain CAWD 149" /LENGTH=94 /DNA_ID=CAMNT_0011519881 /DNA_START=77 /DNA_END=358 /DNA_ORIENTATION=+
MRTPLGASPAPLPADERTPGVWPWHGPWTGASPWATLRIAALSGYPCKLSLLRQGALSLVAGICPRVPARDPWCAWLHDELWGQHLRPIACKLP